MCGGLYNGPMLSIDNHRRDSAGLTYIYPVISRRAGGVSIGINLNVNNACNWACVYCQVENLRRGGPPPVDLTLLERELVCFLDDALRGDFMRQAVPPEMRRLVDVAFSGNGEPTSAREFPRVLALVRQILEQRNLLQELPIRLITNGSLLHRRPVQSAIREIGEAGGEVWFKLDRVGLDDTACINGVPLTPEKVLANLRRCARLAPTWVQTCWFSVDGKVPDLAQRGAYCELLAGAAELVAGVHLYGLARPSQQPMSSRLGRLEVAELELFAAQILTSTGVRVVVNP